ncbi:gamma carbonic anhydrase family protein [Terrihabitans rhizophilus]|uniref:Gamma carbonic anhydrase family protein n=1 Tax=Terrihabitans rhizophilus TaxID=3092662 RepID=A0ABU4RPG8_9HYPH|nr:gamma carbonic anhydrase family protein [Terrihabitans sp. PJ23]MDX6806501.1 gamma carbonic anhydrase family protein [Terrihabitans sp. PJ23]
MPLHRLGALAPDLPSIGNYWIAPDARIIGNVRLGEGATVWFGAVLRGDCELIDIGSGSNVQDGCVLHVDPGFPLTLGKHVSVGHRAILHGCTVGEGSLIGMGATVLNGCVVGRNCLVGANALLTQNAVFPDGSLILGSPAKRVRDLTDEEIARCLRTAEGYMRNVARYGQDFSDF